MTERRRRRWLPDFSRIPWQGWVAFMLLGIAIGAQSIYSHHQDVLQQRCIASNTSALNEVLTKRGDLSEQESAANAAESAATRQLIIDAFASKNRQQAFAAFRRAQAGWAAVDKTRAHISRQRAKNPIPDFPVGTCN